MLLAVELSVTVFSILRNNASSSDLVGKESKALPATTGGKTLTDDALSSSLQAGVSTVATFSDTESIAHTARRFWFRLA